MSIKQKIKNIINGIIRRGYWFRNIFFADCWKFLTYSTFNTQVINLGSTSSLHAFDYDGLPVKGANWALSHNPLSGDLAVIKNYSSFLSPEGCKVLISLCPFSSLSGSYEIFEDRYYTILYPTTIPSYSYCHNILVQDKFKNPFRYYSLYGFILDIIHLLPIKRNKSLSEKQMELDAENRLKSWLHEFSLKDLTSAFSLVNIYNMELAISLLEQIVEFCKERGFDPVIVIPPVYHTLSDKFSKESQDKLMLKMIEGLSYNDITFLNYFSDKQFSNNRDLFEDSFLLNKKGAVKFTRRVLTDISVI